ncbi:MAG: nucleoside monophosphate kinase [Alphaproteobacteria bacterium]|nr:nucleoside monophosphate kinase [Alphaproteobacteria bacterium]
MIVVFLGPPGCGKGTQASFLNKAFGFYHLSTGDEIRNEIREKTPLGLQIAEPYERGELLSDKIVLEIVEKIIAKHATKSILFDGFPRTLPQAQSLDDVLGKHHLQVDAVISFSVDDDLIVQRVLGRIVCGSCQSVYNTYTNPTKESGVCDHCGSQNFIRRTDDTEDALKTRLDLYKKTIEPVKEYYIKKEKLVNIDASKGAGEVTQSLLMDLNIVEQGE